MASHPSLWPVVRRRLLAGMTLCILLRTGVSLAQDSAPLPADPQRRAVAGSAMTAPGDHEGTLSHGGLTRRYLLHVPPSYRPGTPMPLLVSLHGGGAHMAYQASDANYGQVSKADQAGFIVVFPNGFSPLPSGKLATWNAGDCCGPARDRGIDDVGFIALLVERLTQQLDIDRQKVFATGMSNGGLMAHRLACELPQVFKAIAAVAGSDNTRQCSPRQPVSVLQIHARDDDNLPFEGGRGSKSRGNAVTDFTPVPVSVSRWVARNRCSPEPQRALEVPGAVCERYTGCDGQARVELCTTERGGHSWPGARRWRGDEPPSTAIDANDRMWDFFLGR